MKRRDALILLGVVATATPAHAAKVTTWPFSRRTSRRPLLLAGSSAMFELNRALTVEFSKRYPHIDVVIEAGSSLSALIALKRGAIDVAAMDRDLTEGEDEKSLCNYLIARNAVDIVVNRESTISSLTSDQVRGLLTGEIVNWARVGGPNAAVQVVAGAHGTPARHFIEEEILAGGDLAVTTHVCDTPKQIIETVANDPRAIGCILFKDRQDGESVRHVLVNGVDASPATILSNRYPYTQSLYLAVMNDDPKSPARLFVDFTRSAAGQSIVDTHRFVTTY
ncbi:MAG: hypothetical protein EPO08_16280 [Rhodospirillaceae bacterium]|nr:MAG: hypothetical protein EPO08_16280 [Rhodospirillaceae bacterium]